MTDRHVFANLGRGKGEGAVVESLRRIERLNYDVVALVEIDEGDVGYKDLALVHAGLSGHVLNAGKHDLLVIADGQKVGGYKSRRGCPGLKRQSPTRTIEEVVVDGKASIVVHLPAGARNGQRPAAVKVQLEARWSLCWTRLRRAVKRHHKAGRPVTVHMDANARTLPRLHRHAQVVAHHGPDFIFAVPPPGHTVKVVEVGQVDLAIEALHKALWVDLDYRPTRPAKETR